MTKPTTQAIAAHLVKSFGFKCAPEGTEYKRTLHKDGVSIIIRLDRTEYNRIYYERNRHRIAMQRHFSRRGIKVYS